jgi:imidazolonepropionase-like amidohydrolase
MNARMATAMLLTIAGTVTMAPSARAAAEAPARVLFTNVRIFDGASERLIDGKDVLVEGRLIREIGPALSVPEATVIDGGGRTLMPGLIDCHSHLNINGAHGLASTEAEQTWQDIATVAVAKGHVFLEEGFTTVRDMGGMAAGLQRQIDAGLVVGPRIYPSGAFIGPPGGHGDFRAYTMPQVPGISQTERLGIAYLVNGPDEVTAAARQNFMQGATQLKLMQTGGVASLFDPWQLNGLNEDEIRAAVAVANNYGSYVAAHSYSKDSILRALHLGVKTIEHGFMFDGEIAKLMRKKGAYLVTQMTSQAPGLADDPALQDPRTAYKLKTAQEAFKDFIANVKKHEPDFGFQVDAVGGPEATRKQIAYEKHLHAQFFGNHHMLKAATSTAGEIVALSGMVLNPYKEGPLGVVQEGAYADLLLVDGNPLEDITVIGAVDAWFDAPPRGGVETIRLIMKDGVIHKNTLADAR